jgi:raffinose/stachyose/melibiose transport system substrate-binding protein
MTVRLIIILSALAVLVLATPGCGRRESDDEVSLWHIHTDDPMKSVIGDAVGRFKTGHPDVEVSNVAIANDAYKTKLRSSVSNPPDLFMTWGGSVLADYARREVAAELVEPAWRENIHPAALELCSLDGRQYAVPLDVAVVGMWYNTEIFAEHNLTPPETFDDLLEACATLRRAGVTPIALGASKKWPAAFYFIYCAARRGGRELSDRAAALEPGVFASETFAEAGRDVQRLVAAGAFPEKFKTLENTDAYAMFFEGEAAMILMGNWIVGNARGHDEKLPEDAEAILPRMDVFAFPSLGSPEHDDVVLGGVNTGFALSTQAPETADDLLRALTDRTTAVDWLERTGRLPARTDIDIAASNVPEPTAKAHAMLEGASAFQPYYDQFLPASLRQLHLDTVYDLFVGRLTPEEAAQKMEQEAERVRE